jgi:diguanylate cyclase
VAVAQQEDWRRKYFDSIAAIESEARAYNAQLRVLYRLIVRLCAVAQGQSPRIDAELKRLKDAVRREAKAEELESFGDSIAEAVRELEDSAPTATATATLQNHQAAPQIESAFRQEPSTASAGPATASISTFSGGISQVCDALLRLVGELRQLPEYSADIVSLNAEISPSLTGAQLPGVIARVGGLLVQRIHTLEKERQGLQVLLDQMLGQLDALNAYVKGNAEEESRRHQSSDTLNLQITGEVRAMGESVQNGDDLEQLRAQLGARLQSIGQHLQSFRDREQEHARLSRERASRMRMRMEEMEGETRALQERLSDEQRQALVDPLTRIPNRLAWDQRIVDELARWERFHQPTCVLAWDIDTFKAINDRYGHRAGDKVLVVVAESLATGIRGTDFVARYGGEEFVMLLPGTSVTQGIFIANQMREAIEATGFHFRGSPVSVTISCGITELRPGDKAEEAFDRADRAMYQAKNGGRNRVVAAT